ncbi:DNA-binding transcriptional regulator, LysR family [Enhydrobacter aerosaccus]|uniref:DNA-binding transcriptional regulator, LysR family n=1 Tax=Enhydrobacter aerosaccus TaxID=225324 RepID=A0A1T4JRJ1_9HYPH|nr:LysR family transcriptional regulator [Enhydrobacter aerosaccus]SJZ32735.1 DNA-binding transcriptional regulator, LysR family [Enhydrobacter aerosaccus]
MDRLDELAIFVRIVEEGSLIRAARKLRRSPPSVTRALAALEQRLGLRLVDRTTRRLAPTEAGRALLARAQSIVGEYEAAVSGASEAPVQGVLRIAAPVQFGRRHVAPVALAFLDRFAGVEIELVLGDRNVDLIDEAIDVAVRIGHLADTSLTVRHVGEVRRLWLASPGYLKKRGAPEAPTDLMAHDVVLGTGPAAPEWTFAGARRHRRAGSVQLRGRFRVDDVETRLQAARAGRGIVQLLSYQAADDLAAGRLVRLLQAYEPPPLPVQLLTKGRSNRPPKVEAFLDFAAKRLLALPVIRPESDRMTVRSP